MPRATATSRPSRQPAALPVAAEPVARYTTAPAADSGTHHLAARARDCLGGSRYWRQRPASRAEVHAAIVEGVPCGSLVHLVRQSKRLSEQDIAQVLGISTRTLRRQADHPDKPMPADLASRAWLFAETLAKASDVFGGQEPAEAWLTAPAAGLDGHRPIDLLQTLQGAELVTDFLTRLEHGVYS